VVPSHRGATAFFLCLGGFLSELAPIDVAPAESSPAITLDSLSPSERQTWRETGTFPDRSDAVADSSPVSPESPAASTDASVAPASEPGPSAKKGAEHRKAELAAEIQGKLKERLDLQREIEELRRQRTTFSTPALDVKHAAPSSAPAVTSDEPNWDTDFESQIGTKYETWGQAQGAFLAARDAWKDAQIAQRQQRVSEHDRVVSVTQRADEQIREFQQRDPAFWDKVTPEVKAIQPLSAARLIDPTLQRTAQFDIGEVIVTSPQPAELMLHLSTHPEVFRALTQAESPADVYRQMGRIEGSLTPLMSGTDSVPVTSPVSSAPPPPPTLGSKQTAPLSESEQALKSGDFRAYRAAMNREEMAQKR
jgi:hypothetical protein